MFILYFLLFVSVLTDTLRQIYNDHFGKNILITTGDALLFNFVCGVGSVVLFLCCAPFSKAQVFVISSFSMILALIFGAVTAIAQYLAIMAMATGPMSYSVLFTYLGSVIPTVFGILWFRQSVTVCQIIGSLLMLVTFFLGLDLKREKNVSGKWVAFAVGCFFFWGFVGICQVLHQSSEHAEELIGFLLWTFIFMTVIFAVLYLFTPRKKEDGYRIRSKATIPVLLSGLVIGAVNLINLDLSGKLPSVIFFPIVNGGVIVLSIIASVLFLHEKLDAKKLIGLTAGLVSVILLGF